MQPKESSFWPKPLPKWFWCPPQFEVADIQWRWWESHVSTEEVTPGKYYWFCMLRVNCETGLCAQSSSMCSVLNRPQPRKRAQKCLVVLAFSKNQICDLFEHEVVVRCSPLEVYEDSEPTLNKMLLTEFYAGMDKQPPGLRNLPFLSETMFYCASVWGSSFFCWTGSSLQET